MTGRSGAGTRAAAAASPTGLRSASTGAGPFPAGTAAVGPCSAAVGSSSAARAWSPDTCRSGTSLMNRTSTKPSTITAAAVRNTRCIESAKPILNGTASRGSSFWMNDESLSTCVAPEEPCPCPCTKSSTGRFAGSARTAGSRRAARKEAVSATDVKASAIFPGTWVNSRVVNTAVPAVPPICRKNVEEALATPMSCGGTVFCIARTSVCMQQPSPRPRTSM